MDNGSQQESSDLHVHHLPIASVIGVEDHTEEADDAAVDYHDDGSEGQDEVSNKRMKRHTDDQIKHLESVFERCTYLGGNQRVELAKKLGMEERQVKFWFQNRRTRKKMHDERQEGMWLQEENDVLHAENKVLKEAIWANICFTCGSPVVPAIPTVHHRYLSFQNMRLADELQHATAVFNMVAQDADVGLPPVFPLTDVSPLPQFGFVTGNNQTSLVIDPPSPSHSENQVSTESANSTSTCPRLFILSGRT
uniref:Homeobox domain-containing protein n=1 Tax=Oryza nivara TaxID=4536 RepID=A0A0E0HZN0_ORYNI